MSYHKECYVRLLGSGNDLVSCVLDMNERQDANKKESNEHVPIHTYSPSFSTETHIIQYHL